MKRVSPAVARRYASALLDVALQEKDSEAPAKLREEMRDARELLGRQEDLAAALTHPTIPSDRKKGLVAAIWSEARATLLFRRLMELLVERGRVGLLPAVERSFSTQWNEHRNVALAEVLSAVELRPAQVKAIAGALEGVTRTQIEVESALDPELLGGVVVRMGGRSYDGSVRGRLRALRERLAAGG
jgi:F-type H+-transporting ATPase subunit delta